MKAGKINFLVDILSLEQFQIKVKVENTDFKWVISHHVKGCNEGPLRKGKQRVNTDK